MTIKEILSNENLHTILIGNGVFHWIPGTTKDEIASWGFTVFEGEYFPYPLIEIPNIQDRYPPLFEQFWMSYHEKRRKRKQNAYEKWRKISQADRALLPGAAKNCSEEAALKMKVEFMPLPENFIKNKEYLDHLEKRTAPAAADALDYWNQAFRAATRKNYAWDQKSRDKALSDITALGTASWRELVWVFFAQKDPDVRKITDRSGFGYHTFHWALGGALANTKYRPKKACPECGGTDQHELWCSVAVKRKEVKETLEAEYNAAAEMNVDIVGEFRRKVGR